MALTGLLRPTGLLLLVCQLTPQSHLVLMFCQPALGQSAKKEGLWFHALRDSMYSCTGCALHKDTSSERVPSAADCILADYDSIIDGIFIVRSVRQMAVKCLVPTKSGCYASLPTDVSTAFGGRVSFFQ